jgi:transcriptional regulator with XRE-family HTH domain
MDHRNSPTPLRLCRRSAGFSQPELARIFGLRHGSYLSRIERGKLTLRVEQALRYELFFGLPLTKIAPNLCGPVLNRLWEDITAALHTDTGGASRRAERKRKFLRAALERIESLNG